MHCFWASLLVPAGLLVATQTGLGKTPEWWFRASALLLLIVAGWIAFDLVTLKMSSAAPIGFEDYCYRPFETLLTKSDIPAVQAFVAMATGWFVSRRSGQAS